MWFRWWHRDALVQRNLEISDGRSLYPQVMACNWSGSFLPPGNSTHGAAARPYGYASVANMSLTVCCFVSGSCLLASFTGVFIELSCVNTQQKNSVTLPVSPLIKSPREINIINIYQKMHAKKTNLKQKLPDRSFELNSLNDVCPKIKGHSVGLFVIMLM